VNRLFAKWGERDVIKIEVKKYWSITHKADEAIEEEQ